MNALKKSITIRVQEGHCHNFINIKGESFSFSYSSQVSFIFFAFLCVSFNFDMYIFLFSYDVSCSRFFDLKRPLFEPVSYKLCTLPCIKNSI